MTECAYFTICSANYLAYAKTLHASLQAADPAAAKNFFIVLVDERLDPEIENALPCKVVYAEDLGIEAFWDMAFRYSVMELNTAVKPAAILHFMDRGFGRVMYLDPDLYIIKPLKHVHEAHNAGSQVVLTPHSMQPLEDSFDPDDVRLMRTGAYNLGFASFADYPASRALLEWWHRRMLVDCRVDLENGLFVDQKFMDLAPSYGEDVHILRHPGYNVAYWNLASRPVSKQNSTWKVGRHALHFFHFSGVVPGNPNVFSKHQNRFGVDDIGPLKGLLDEYLEQLDKQGHDVFSTMPYGFGAYENGQPVPDIARRVYGANEPSSTRSREDLFNPNFSFLDEPARDVPSGRMPVTRVMSQIWKERPDLHRSFHLADDNGREAFCRWFIHSARSEYNLPPEAYTSVARATGVLDKQRHQGPSKFLSRRWLANTLMERSTWLRGAYRKLPHDVRVNIREFVMRTASGHGTKGAQLSGPTSFDASLPAGVGIYGYLSAVSGVGEGARRMTDIVAAADIDTSRHVLIAPGHASESVPLDNNAQMTASPFNTLIFHINADQMPREMDRLPANWLRGRYRIGYWAWELAEFPKAWLRSLDYVHEVWVPSKFVQNAVQKKTDKPVVVIPHPIPHRRDSGESRTSFGLPNDQFLFLCSFDLKSFVSRKNPMAAYEAFCKAFPDTGPESGARLVVKLHGGLDDGENGRELVTQLANDRRIILIDVPLSNERYAALQRLCDCYISLHRSEGFGMNIAECMQLGKPVIATNYSGNRDYLGDEIGYPVRYQLVPVRPGDYPESGGQVWAEPDLDHASELMRHVFEHQEQAAEKGTAARAFMLDRYAVSTIARTVHQQFERIQKMHFRAQVEERASETMPNASTHRSS
ncbi:glycosyltransferase family 4 protein [Henriciella sp. AS95]|uniref:glycosyltransferase family 4 protein n=1 Tax=Henriciella sp. AS95 TaxID=3135782 RepID=UPI00316E334F